MPNPTKSYGKSTNLTDSNGNLVTIGDGESVIIENNNGEITTKAIPVVGVDNDGSARIIKTATDGSLNITQIELFSTFRDILKELKKLNLQMVLMTDTNITNKDIEV